VADSTQPAMVQKASEPKRPLASGPAMKATKIIPINTPLFWIPESLVEPPGV